MKVSKHIGLEKAFKATNLGEIDPVLIDDTNKIIAWQSVLQTIDVSNVEPIYNTVDNSISVTMNNDCVEEEKKNVLFNAPKQYNDFFLVPKIVKGRK